MKIARFAPTFMVESPEEDYWPENKSITILGLRYCNKKWADGIHRGLSFGITVFNLSIGIDVLLEKRHGN